MLMYFSQHLVGNSAPLHRQRNWLLLTKQNKKQYMYKNYMYIICATLWGQKRWVVPGMAESTKCFSREKSKQPQCCSGPSELVDRFIASIAEPVQHLQLSPEQALLNSIRRLDQYVWRLDGYGTMEIKPAQLQSGLFGDSDLPLYGGVLARFLDQTKTSGTGLKEVKRLMQDAPCCLELQQLCTSVVLRTLLCLQACRVKQQAALESQRSSTARRTTLKTLPGWKQKSISAQSENARKRRMAIMSNSTRAPLDILADEPPRFQSAPIPMDHPRSRALSTLSAKGSPESLGLCNLLSENRDVSSSRPSCWLPNLAGASGTNDSSIGGGAEFWAALLADALGLVHECIATMHNVSDVGILVTCINILRLFVELDPYGSSAELIFVPLEQLLVTPRDPYQSAPTKSVAFHLAVAQPLPTGFAVILRALKMHQLSFALQGAGGSLVLTLLRANNSNVLQHLCSSYALNGSPRDTVTGLFGKWLQRWEASASEKGPARMSSHDCTRFRRAFHSVKAASVAIPKGSC